MPSIRPFNELFETSSYTAMDRRELFKSFGVAASIASLASCSKKAEKILPYARELEGQVERGAYTSAIDFKGFAQGTLANTYQGRPIKLEGHPGHAASGGAANIFTQTSLFELYHPERIKEPVWKGSKIDLENLEQKLVQTRNSFPEKGKGVVFWTRPQHSLSRAKALKDLKKALPKARYLRRGAMGPSGARHLQF